ncbi:pyridoxamine 5'-phosphate oxidase family protein [Kineococcus sp. SYSU DK004]|uniref:pyridoxamine 5'-phosphate oxidase family protein n=1 Tax=Kineococcus sp. SYSU DK004 TaxID=3383125 RepID=UPI003D7DE1C9
MVDEGDEGRGTTEVLSRDDCFRFLQSHQVGRLGVVLKGYPVIVPVNYALDRGVVVVRTRSGSTLSAADHANVCFEVDQVDPAHRTGWSVLVRGLAEDVTDLEGDDVLRASRAAGADPWVGERDRWLRVIPHEVTGRRIRPPELAAVELGGYL